MWQKLLGHFKEPPVDEAERQRLAVAVLLLECARADFERSEAELAVVRDGLRAYLQVDGDELERLLAQASEQARQTVSLHDYIGRLNAALQPSDKLEIFALLWRVAYADGRLDVQEEHLLRRLAELLYVPHRDFIATKLSAEAEAQARAGAAPLR